MKSLKTLFGSWSSISLAMLSIIAVIAVIVYCHDAEDTLKVDKTNYNKDHPYSIKPIAEGSWRFIVSGDSRNCGDVVMPAIAAHSERYQPSFYWHLGDLRAIYKIDEDMAAADLKNGGYLGCENYLKRAWSDFIENQIGPFGVTPFYIGIGNHEIIPPKNKPIFPTGDKEPASQTDKKETPPEVKGAQFTMQFADWLLSPPLKEQRIKDKDCDSSPTNNAKDGLSKENGSDKPECLPRNYYHWIQRGVDFIYLDNSANVFGREQLNWFKTRIEEAQKHDTYIHSLVVGMHEALPKSISADHAMCDETKEKNPTYPWKTSCAEGEEVYKWLLDFQERNPQKHVYTLASHSHFYMQGIFNTRPEPKHLRGWIVGTAGAVRYPLPKDKSKSDDYKTDVYGYLLGTVDKNGEITFEFQELKEQNVPDYVAQRYPSSFVSWCFAHNSENIDPHRQETTNRCGQPEQPKSMPLPRK
jgi:hypothetical protein